MIIDRCRVKLILLITLFVYLGVTGIYSPEAYGISNMVNVLNAKVAVKKADKAYKNKEFAVAFAAYQKAADAGNAYGQFMLANMYIAGEGVKKDLKKYMYRIRQSADNGYPSSNYLLGMAYLYGDPTAAVKYFKKAARKEHGSAMHMLGLMYAKGVGVKKNTKESLRWFRLAKAQGIPIEKQWWIKSGVEASAIVKEIQQHLISLGYNPGPPDGLIGKKTRTEIKAFQRKTGMKPDGLATVQVLKALRNLDN